MSLTSGARNLAFWWLRGGQPVDEPTAAKRAGICHLCPLNEPESLYEELQGALAEAVRVAFEAKHAMALRLPKPIEDSLMICAACGCELKLLVWSPDNVIQFKKEQDPEAWEKLWENCWQREVVK